MRLFSGLRLLDCLAVANGTVGVLVAQSSLTERRETVFLGFRRAEGNWERVEVRRGALRRWGGGDHYGPNVAPCGNLRPRL
jgi:hypothetical protein